MKNTIIRKIAIVTASILVAGALTACGTYDESAVNAKSMGNSQNYIAYDESLMAETSLESPDAMNGQSSPEEKLIHTYYLSVQSTDMDTTLSAIKEKATALGGYIENSEVNSYEDDSYAYLTLRIPQSSIDDFVDVVNESGNVIHQSDNIDNKTAEYIDYSAKLKALDDEIKRLEALADQTQNISELLEIENTLTSLRAQKDSAQGQLNYIDDKVNFATVNIDLSEVEYFDNDKPSIWKEISERTSDKNSDIRDMVVDYVSAIPYMLVVFILFLIPFTLIVFVVIRVVRFCRKKRIVKIKKKSHSDSEEVKE